MNQADRIRQFVSETYVVPARNRGIIEVEIRAGDIHREMRLSNAMPAVCSALGSNKFEQVAGVTATARSGPSNGSNTKFRFAIDPLQSKPAQGIRVVRNRAPGETPAFAITDAVILVSCVKSKLPHDAPARDLYT